MKRLLMLLIVLLTMVFFVGGSLAAEKKAAKPKVAKTMAVSGKVVTYEEGKMIRIKGSKNKEWTFDIAADTMIKGEVMKGVHVKVTYKKQGGKMVPTAINVITKKAKKKSS